MDSEEEDFYCAASYYSDDEYEPEEIPSLADKEPSLVPLLASNEAPHPSQLAALLEISRKHEATISKVETDISTLETEICDVESTLRALRRRRSALLREQIVLCSEMPQLRGIMSSIRRLPPEIIGEIFLYLTPVLLKGDYRNHRAYSKSDPPPKTKIPWYLGQICRYWRSVALSLRSLWSTFDFHPGRRSGGLAKTEINVDWVFEAVKAAQSTGEHDRRDLPCANMKEDWDFFDAVDRKREQAAYNQEDHGIWEERPKVPRRDFQWDGELTLEEQDQLHDRRRNFSVVIKAEITQREQSLAAASFELSLQRAGPGSFSSRLMGRDYSPNVVVLFEAHLRCLHRLTRLVLVDLHVDLLHRLSQSSANGKQLRRLELVFTCMTALGPTCVWPPPLTELALHNVDLSSHDGIPWAQLLKYFESGCAWTHWNTELVARKRRWAAYSQLTSVVELSLDIHGYWDHDDYPDDPVLLPKLQRARFTLLNQRLLQSFDMPLLQHLSYSYDAAQPNSVSLKASIPHSLSHLRTLRVRGRSTDSSRLWSLGLGSRDILTRAPELTEIFVDIPCVADDLVLNLLPSDEGPPLGSKLKVLELAGVNDYPRLLELLQFRFRSGSATIARPRSFTLYEPEEEELSIFEDVTEEGRRSPKNHEFDLWDFPVCRQRAKQVSIFQDCKEEGWSIQEYNNEAWDFHADE